MEGKGRERVSSCKKMKCHLSGGKKLIPTNVTLLFTVEVDTRFFIGLSLHSSGRYLKLVFFSKKCIISFFFAFPLAAAAAHATKVNNTNCTQPLMSGVREGARTKEGAREQLNRE